MHDRSVRRPPARSITWVSREEQPATVAPPKTARRGSLSRTGAPMTSTADQAIPNQAVPRVAVTAGAPAPPTAIAPTPQGLDQSTGADATAPPYHEHFATVPVAHANSDSAGDGLDISDYDRLSLGQGAPGILCAIGITGMQDDPITQPHPLIRRCATGRACGLTDRAGRCLRSVRH